MGRKIYFLMPERCVQWSSIRCSIRKALEYKSAHSLFHDLLSIHGRGSMERGSVIPSAGRKKENGLNLRRQNAIHYWWTNEKGDIKRWLGLF